MELHLIESSRYLLGGGVDSGGARRVVDQSQLAEEAAGRQLAHLHTYTHR